MGPFCCLVDSLFDLDSVGWKGARTPRTDNDLQIDHLQIDLQQIDYIVPHLLLSEVVQDLQINYRSNPASVFYCRSCGRLPFRQHELDHTDQELFCPETSRSYSGNQTICR